MSFITPLAEAYGDSDPVNVDVWWFEVISQDLTEVVTPWCMGLRFPECCSSFPGSVFGAWFMS